MPRHLRQWLCVCVRFSAGHIYANYFTDLLNVLRLVGRGLTRLNVKCMFTGVRLELCDLVRVEGIDGLRARTMHAMGLTSVAALVAADRKTLIKALQRSTPYESDTDQQADPIKPW